MEEEARYEICFIKASGLLDVTSWGQRKLGDKLMDPYFKVGINDETQETEPVEEEEVEGQKERVANFREQKLSP